MQIELLISENINQSQSFRYFNLWLRILTGIKEQVLLQILSGASWTASSLHVSYYATLFAEILLIYLTYRCVCIYLISKVIEFTEVLYYCEDKNRIVAAEIKFCWWVEMNTCSHHEGNETIFQYLTTKHIHSSHTLCGC